MKYVLVIWMLAKIGSGTAITSEQITYQSKEKCEEAKALFIRDYEAWVYQTDIASSSKAGGYCLPSGG